MRSLRSSVRPLLASAALVIALFARPAPAATGPNGALGLVPDDAASVGLIRFSALRSSPLSARLFSDMDHLSTDGDAARFMEEAGLRPREDVDVVVACLVPAEEGGEPRPLVLFEGRFDPARLAEAAMRRGALKETIPAGVYYRLPPSDSSRQSGQPGAVAFVDRGLVVAGTEGAVTRALAERAGGATGFSSGRGLGRELSRIDPDATAWALVDVAKAGRPKRGSGRGPGAGLTAALQNVSVFAIQTNVSPEFVEVRAQGLSPDEETRELLEDALRGLTAAWRMAAQERSPELVSAIRRFKVSRDEESVTIEGRVPAELVRNLIEQSRHRTATR